MPLFVCKRNINGNNYLKDQSERMTDMEKRIKDFVFHALALILLGLLCYILIKYGLFILLPFILAFGISAGIRPLSLWLDKKTRVNKKVWCVSLIVLSTGALFGSLGYLANSFAREIKEILKTAGQVLSDKESPIGQMSDRMMGALKNTRIGGESVDLDIGGMLSGALSSATQIAAKAFGNIVNAAPGFFLFVVVFILSLYYFSADRERIKKDISRFLPERIMRRLSSISKMGLRVMGRFLKVYMSLFGITFAILLLGFYLMKVDYPLLGAVLCTVVDILPVFGVGTVLVPWTVILFLTGETVKGVWMAVLFLVIYILRQILEPRLVGEAAGVHPIIALFSVFLGYSLAGVSGMIFAPLVLNGAVVFWEERRKKSQP